MKKTIAILVGVTLVIGATMILRSPPPRDHFFERVVVQRGTIAQMLRETGTATPRDPVLVKTPVGGVLEWVVEDEKWVEAGARVCVVNDDEALKEVTQFRIELLGERQELDLARVRREHAARLEDQVVRSAQRAYELAATRHRILSARPEGGHRLIEIHEQLLPLEEESRQLRGEYERAQDIYQDAQDAYLDRLDLWQEQHDAIARTQAKIDQYTIQAEADVDETSAELTSGRDEAKQQLADARLQLGALKENLPELARVRDEAARHRDKAATPRDELHDRLAKRDEQERELYTQLEIEKRAVELAKFQLDREIGKLTLEEAGRKRTEGKLAFSSGAISADALEKLEAEVVTASKELTVLDRKIEIAARPAPEEVLEEARLKMEQAEVKARTAEQARDRSLRALDQEIVMLEATVEKVRFQVDRADKQFPSVIESNIKFLTRELEGLEETKQERREAIITEIKELEPQLERASANPPNIVTTPSAGVVRLSKRWGRTYYAGLNVSSEAVVARIFPARNMEIRTAINEANVRRISEHMPVRITVPALGGRELTGVINMVAGIGKDKMHEFVSDERPLFAGVTQFESRIRIDDVPADLRPGMSVIVEIEIERQEDVLHLPRGAVRERNGEFLVKTGSSKSPKLTPLAGRFFGDDSFIVEDGLEEGSRVLVERRRSH